jgi:sugar-specific transcriptional regulator TrmB
MDNIKNILTKLGLSQKEVAVYEIILGRDLVSPSEISKISKIKRSTVYVITESLLSKRLITRDDSSKTMKVRINKDKDLKSVLELDKEKIREKESNLDDLVKELEQVKSKKLYPVPKVSFIEKEKIDDFLYDNLEKWFDSSKDEKICYGFQDANFVKEKQKWINWAIKKSERNGYKTTILSNNNSVDNHLYKHDKTREILFSKKTKFTSTTWVVGVYIIMITIKEDKEYLVEIQDQEMAYNMMEMFKEALDK